MPCCLIINSNVSADADGKLLQADLRSLDQPILNPAVVCVGGICVHVCRRYVWICKADPTPTPVIRDLYRVPVGC